MRLAVYNVENLFDRPKVMNLGSWAEGKLVLEKFEKLSALLGEINYTEHRKAQIVALMKDLGLEKDDQGPYVILRRNRGTLLKRPKTGGLEITATGRADWAGALELVEGPVDEQAMRNTARVMIELKADVLAVVEAESRPALAAFNDTIVKALGGTPYHHVMVIDGNDDRGIDVGIMTRPGYPLGTMTSHVDDRNAKGARVFSRDCPEFGIALKDGRTLWVLVNHFKSKGYGLPAASNARRTEQAARVQAIYQALVARGEMLVAVAGDFNDTPDSAPLEPLLKQGDLVDVFRHPAFDDGGYPGTYGSCTAANKIDYLLLSPELMQRFQAGGVVRTGMWPGVKPKKWAVFPEVTRPEDAASDHAGVWVDLEV